MQQSIHSREILEAIIFHAAANDGHLPNDVASMHSSLCHAVVEYLTKQHSAFMPKSLQMQEGYMWNYLQENLRNYREKIDLITEKTIRIMLAPGWEMGAGFIYGLQKVYPSLLDKKKQPPSMKEMARAEVERFIIPRLSSIQAQHVEGIGNAARNYITIG